MNSWLLGNIIYKLRFIANDKSTGDSELTDVINDYYMNLFPIESQLEDFEADFVQQLLVSDDGNYLIDEDYLELKPPYTINNAKATLYTSKDKFDAEFPIETDPMNLTDPGLAIGSSKANVANVAFSYRIAGVSYSKAAVAAGTALSGDTVPQSKYGAWRLEIDSDGTITIVEADDNATGYDSAAQAVRDLGAESSDNNCMGFVTVIDSNSTFIPGTTELDSSGCTATYTDGYHSSRSTPYGVLIDRRRIWVGPKPDDIHVFKCTAVERPDALTATTAPLNISWATVIAHGAAVLIVEDNDLLMKLMAAKEHYMNLIKRPGLRQMSQTRSQPRC